MHNILQHFMTQLERDELSDEDLQAIEAYHKEKAEGKLISEEKAGF